MMLEVWERCDDCRDEATYVLGHFIDPVDGLQPCHFCNSQDWPVYARHPGYVRVLRPVVEVLKAAGVLPT